MKLFVDLQKAINKGQLVKRAVQVRGKNGKIFTRMQWVSPDEAKAMSVRPSSHEDVAEKTQKEHIDEHVKKMSREDKYKHLADHKVEWKRNEKSDAIDHKNAVMALKDHLYQNPHLAGAEHLPTERGASDEEVLNHSIKKFTDKYKNHGELLHKMMHHLGVADSPDDPRKSDPQKGAINHMRRMMKLKSHLKSNPHHMHEMMSHSEYGAPFGDEDRKGHGDLEVKKVEPKPKEDKPEPKPEPKLVVTEPAKPKEALPLAKQLGKIPREKLYEVMKELGIADGDPVVMNPDDKSSPIMHMRNMMKLKAKIGEDPSILSKLGIEGETAPPTKAGTSPSSTPKEKKDVHEVDDLFSKMDKEDKENWIAELRDHHLISNRVNSGLGTPQNYIHALHAVKELFKNHPDVWEQHKKQVEQDALVGSTKISNEDMTSVLKQLVGLKEGLTKERATSGFRKQQSWEFNVASTAEITKNENGEAVLSIVDAGFDGEDFNEIEVPLQEVLDFLKEKKEKKGTSTKDTKEKAPITESLPLHKQGAGEIWKAIVNDNSKITPEVAQALQKDLYNMWSKAGFTRDFMTLALQGGRSLPAKTVQSVLEKLGVELRGGGSTMMEVDNGNFKKAFYSHLIQKTKSGDATALVIDNRAHPKDNWVLHESAKNWSDEERTSARQDFIKANLIIKGANEHILNDEQKLGKLSEFIHKSTAFMPFDMMTDMMTKGFAKIKFDDSVAGSHYDANNREVVIHHQHLNSEGGLNKDSRLQDFHHEWKGTTQLRGKTVNVSHATHGFADTVAHEFAHAIDHYLSSQSDATTSNGGYLNWGTTDTSKKYLNSLGLNPNMVKDSYIKAIKATNPEFKYVTSTNNGQPYALHLDSFISSYEGRIYNGSLINGESGSGDKGIDHSKGTSGMIALEHWSEGVSRVVNAVRAHKEYVADTGSNETLDEWAENMSASYHLRRRVPSETSKTGDLTKESRLNRLKALGDEGEDTFGKAYHIMKQQHPELVDGIHKLFFRGDFVDQAKQANKVEKSEFLYILE